MSLLLAGLIVGWGAFQETQGTPDFEVKTPGGFIRLYNFANVEVEEDGTVKGKAQGKRVTLVDTERGLTLVGSSMDISLSRVPKGFAVERALVTGDAQVTYDSKVAFEALKASSVTPPAAPKSFQVTELRSATVNYSVAEGKGTLTLPEALQITSKESGMVAKKIENASTMVPFDQNMTVTGSKGTVTVGLNPDGTIAEPDAARVEGPVVFKLTRNETLPAGVELTNLNGSTDLLEGVFTGTKEPSLTATGNVKLRGEGSGFTGRVTGTKAVILLDENRKPIRYRFTGNPATTRVNTGGAR